MEIALFVTCLVDFFRPSIGFATIELLRQAGHKITVPEDQTCCGQPAFNNGDVESARAIAKRVIHACADFDRIVVPSGSCGGMIRLHYPELFDGDPEWYGQAVHLAERCRELTEFLIEARVAEPVNIRFPHQVAYHDSCSCLRELGVRDQPRRLLRNVSGLELHELGECETCCGFGGTFCIKYPEISRRLVDDKVDAIMATGADTLAAADLGCLLNISGRLRRRNVSVRVFHIAEILAGMAGGPGIGGCGTA